MYLSYLFAIIGCVLTAVQIVLVKLKGAGVCLNDGCEIVDQFTTVDPLYYNIAGFFFFLIISIGIAQARKGVTAWRSITGLLLLCGLAAEGVFFSFQLFVTQTFCSYCLLVLALIALANCFMGISQMIKGIFIFTAVVLASYALDYQAPANTDDSLAEGTLARLDQDGSRQAHYFFFSADCPHCEAVIEEIRRDNRCAINFNPIEEIENFSLPRATTTASYNPQINVRFLTMLGIETVPVLLLAEPDGWSIRSGEQDITAYLERSCQAARPQLPDTPIGETSVLDSLSLQDSEDGCTIEQDCEEPYQQSVP
jgi:hypothetical protein